MPTSACAACRIQRKKCSEDCLLAPHFPSHDPDKFAIVQSVFGTSHIVKMLQGIKAEERAEAVNSMVFEATARTEDPVHGSANVVQQLQKQIAEMKTQLESMREELTNLRSQYDKIVLLLNTGSLDAENAVYPTDALPQPSEEILYEEVDPMLLWDPLWEL
ncbi:hypothetical protein SUGI_0414050 [Cryptomeria japonica]|uniref:LOB domain-containing protein 1-like n=1 Tax=Cryptomeria japonica TaxID=3369 RepID=UPI002408C33D|nr:LOB domain-containing protein 1-like [Cryptomeria japonica]GLJ22089.1 hypothetical protein SUGI_0414050 [Cryptomeria japonica]